MRNARNPKNGFAKRQFDIITLTKSSFCITCVFRPQGAGVTRCLLYIERKRFAQSNKTNQLQYKLTGGHFLGFTIRVHSTSISVLRSTAKINVSSFYYHEGFKKTIIFIFVFFCFSVTQATDVHPYAVEWRDGIIRSSGEQKY